MNARSRISRRRGLGVLTALVALLTGALARASDEDSGKVVITGTVVNASSRPIAGAVVSATTLPEVEPVQTDKRGAFKIALPKNEAGSLYTALLAKHGEGEETRLGMEGILVQAAASPASVQIVLKPARTLDVQANDGEGRPVEGAEVHYLSNLRQLCAGRTDAQGHWRQQVPADAPNWSVYAHKSKVGFDYATAERPRGSTDKPRPLPDQLTLTLNGARPPLRVKCTAADGKPLAGVEVGPWLITLPGHEATMNGMGDAHVKTDASGAATLYWLPATVSSPTTIVAHAEGYYTPEYGTPLPADKPVDEITIKLLPNERLSGRITTADGQPAAGATVAMEGHGASMNPFHGATKTGADGRYALKVHSEMAYVIAATKGDLAAPYKAGVVVRAGKPTEGVDLVLGSGTRVKGRVTVGQDNAPVWRTMVQAMIDKGSIPDELKPKDDRFYRQMAMYMWEQTDRDGRYEFLLGPGEYTLSGPARVKPIKVTIPAENPPAEIVRDFAMPRPDKAPFTVTVVGADGKPVAGALVEGAYRAQNGWFPRATADDHGTLRTERSLDPLVLWAAAPDKSHAAVVHLEAEGGEAKVVLQPTATATGRLVDETGSAVANRKLDYGIRVYQGPPIQSPFSWHFGGSTTTDEAGKFRLPGLAVGEKYDVYSSDEAQRRFFTAKETVNPASPGPLDLGDVVMDFSPPKPYVPPTSAQLAAQSFSARKEMNARQKLDYTLNEAKREYTRPLLLFGSASDPACVELFRLFNERSAAADEQKTRKTPADLRWDFELAALDASQADVQALAKELGVALEPGGPPSLAMLTNEGKFAATYPLGLDKGKKLDAPALSAFLLEHKLATRDDEAMLAEALAQAKDQDKRVFLIMSASWCGPCRLLARFLTAHKAELAKHYVFVKLDVSRDQGANVLRDRYEGKDQRNGIPWYVILDVSGKPLINSNASEPSEREGLTNIGFPSEPAAVDHFLKMLEQTAPGLSSETLGALRKDLEK